MITKLKKFVPSLLFFSFITWMIVQADMDKSNIIMEIGRSVPWGDKIGHFMLFGILALLINMALSFKQVIIRKRLFHVGSLIVFSFAAIEEFSQLAFSTRTFDLIDMLFDLFGIGLFSSVAFRRFLVQKIRSFADYLNKRFVLND